MTRTPVALFNVSKCEKCRKILAEPKELIRIEEK